MIGSELSDGTALNRFPFQLTRTQSGVMLIPLLPVKSLGIRHNSGGTDFELRERSAVETGAAGGAGGKWVERAWEPETGSEKKDASRLLHFKRFGSAIAKPSPPRAVIRVGTAENGVFGYKINFDPLSDATLGREAASGLSGSKDPAFISFRRSEMSRLLQTFVKTSARWATTGSFDSETTSMLRSTSAMNKAEITPLTMSTKTMAKPLSMPPHGP
jgi:hypothetical protein